MTYTTGELIVASDYNSLATTNPSILGHWGGGSGRHGLGQDTSLITPVATGEIVLAEQWSHLITIINKCLNHQGRTNVFPTQVNAGDVIKCINYIPFATSLAYTSAGVTPHPLVPSTPHILTFTDTWNSLEFTNTISFTTADQARYFFNAGGKVKIQLSHSGSTNTEINSQIHQLCLDVGDILLGYENTTRDGGVGRPSVMLNSNNGGYWSGSLGYVTHVKQFDSFGNYVKVEYKWSGPSTNFGYAKLDFKISLNLANPSFGVAGGISTSTVTAMAPSTKYLTNTWGAP